MTDFVKNDGKITLVGANVKVEIFHTGADRVRNLVADLIMPTEDFLEWMGRGDTVRAQIMQRQIGANIVAGPGVQRGVL